MGMIQVAFVIARKYELAMTADGPVHKVIGLSRYSTHTQLIG